MQQNVHKKREKRGIRKKRKRGKREEIVTTLGSRGVGDERGNPLVMGALVALCSCVFYLNLQSTVTPLEDLSSVPEGSLSTEYLRFIGVVVLGAC